MIVCDRRVCRNRFHPGLASKAVRDMKIRRLIGLCHQQPLLTKRRKQLRLPYAGVEIAGLAVAAPVPIRLREGKIEMVQRPGGWVMRWAREQLEDLARFTPLQIKQGWPRSDPWFHRLQLFALDHQRFDSKRRLVQRAKVGRLGGNDPDRINTAPHDDIEITRRLKTVVLALELDLHDHIVIGHATYTSFRSAGLL
ncbi:hypothetical protein CL689_04595 [Candidatus Saccharibacteria bacterium]|nr:hypothetical protein [Candidatus Saccharibacteria bacterium]